MFDNDALMTDKQYVSIVLYSTWHECRCFHLDPIEGGHRKINMMQASFCEKYNFERGLITNPTSLEPRHFEDIGLCLKDPEKKRSEIQNWTLHNYFQLVKETENNKGFFCKS